MDEDLIPKLKDGVEICPFDTSYTKPTYLIKLNNRLFEISQNYYKLVLLMDGKRTVDGIAIELAMLINKKITSNDVKNMIEKGLIPIGIVSFNDQFITEDSKRTYLYFRMLLLKRSHLQPLAEITQYLFAKIIFYPLLCLAILSQIYFYLILKTPLVQVTFMSGNELIILTAILFISLLIHEMGHISACHYYGANYDGVGVGIYFYFPAFYSDISGAWVLSRMQRAVIDFGGVYFQMLMVPFLIVVYLFLKIQIIVGLIYLLNFSIISNLNPFIRLDGYWIASDLLGIPNLRKKTVDIIKQFYKRLINHSSLPLPILNQVSNHILYLFITYTIISNVFFFFFGFKLMVVFIPAVLNYKIIVYEFYYSFDANFIQIFSAFSKFFFVNIIILSFTFFTYRMLVAGYKKIVAYKSNR